MLRNIVTEYPSSFPESDPESDPKRRPSECVAVSQEAPQLFKLPQCDVLVGIRSSVPISVGNFLCCTASFFSWSIIPDHSFAEHTTSQGSEPPGWRKSSQVPLLGMFMVDFLHVIGARVSN
jgi:hypothetical protein